VITPYLSPTGQQGGNDYLFQVTGIMHGLARVMSWLFEEVRF
jgi:hypothetical protein